MKKLFLAILCMLLMVMLAACSSNISGVKVTESAAPTNNDSEQNEGGEFKQQIAEGRPVKLIVDFQNLTPTIEQKVTAENPNVYVSSQRIADEFMKMHPNVEVIWERGKPDGDIDEWLTTVIAAGTGPDVMFAYGSTYADRGWLMRLNEEIENPNEYVEGNVRWADIFPEYLWNDTMNKDAKNNVIAIPLALFPGPPTAYYYNKEIFEKVGVEPPTDWDEFVEISQKIRDAGYIAVAPWSANKKIRIDAWDFQFSISGPYGTGILDKTDYNHDGAQSTEELLRAAYEGHYLTETNDNAKELWGQLKRKYNDILEPSFANTDYETKWIEGKVAMMEDGLWRYTKELSNTRRTFEFGLFPPPVVTAKSSTYVADVEFTEKGPYNPATQMSFNIIEPSIEAHGGNDVREAAIAFLKYASVPDNLSMMVLEKKGEFIGAVKGTKLPTELNDWFDNSFPKPYTATWGNMLYTSKGRLALSKQLEQWVKGMIDDQTFYQQFDEAYKKDIEDYISNMGIDTSEWVKGW